MGGCLRVCEKPLQGLKESCVRSKSGKKVQSWDFATLQLPTSAFVRHFEIFFCERKPIFVGKKFLVMEK